MHFRFWQRSVWGALLAFALLMVAACDNGTATVSVNNNPAASTPTTHPTSGPAAATPTQVSATQCSQVPGFAGALPAQAGPGFSDVPFPANSISTPLVLHSNGIGLFTIYLFQVCSPNTNMGGVQLYYTNHMVANNWAYSPTLPFDGGYQQSCGDPYCWLSNLAPRYVGLEKIIDVGNGLVTYQMRIFVPPPYPTCPLFNNNYISFLPQHKEVPLPPETVLGVGHGSGSILANTMCSAGTAASVDTFMATEMTKLGWHQGSFSPGGGATFNCGGNFVGWISPDNTHAISWDTASGNAVTNGWQWAVLSCR